MAVKSGGVNSSFSRGVSSSASCFWFKGKSAQITVFIIIGIVILFTFAGIMYFTKTITKKDILTAAEPSLADVPTAFKPLSTYTESCINSVAKKGLLVLGEQGGYIYPDTVGKYSVINPTDADGINLEPLKVPYWHYNVESNSKKNIVYSSLKPELFADDDPEMSIESQLSRYVEERLDECLDDYSPFVNQGFTVEIVSKDAKEVDVNIGDKSVGFLLEMEVKAKIGESEATINKFYVSVPLALKHYYEIANLITETQQENNVLERQGLELISIYSRIDSQYLPPISDVDYQLFSPYVWDEVTVKQKFKDLLVSYVPLLRFLGSSNFYYHTFPEGNRLAQKIIDNSVIPLTGAEDLQVSFDYFAWEPFFKVNSDEGKIEPDHIFINYGVFNFAQQRYETHYDASYPVLVTIKDEYAFNNQGYNFIFALESNIRNNRPAVVGEVIEPYPPSVSSFSCAEEHKTTGVIKTAVIDSFSKEPVELVKIGFTIPEQGECEIGLTDDSGVVEEKYPAVYGGVVNFANAEYLTGYYPMNTYGIEDDDSAIIGFATANVEGKVIELNKKKDVKVKVMKKEFKKCITPLVCDEYDILVYKDISCEKAKKTCFFNSGESLFQNNDDPIISFEADGSLAKYNDYTFIDSAKYLIEDEEAVLMLERVSGFNEGFIEEEFFTTLSVKGNEEVDVTLVPGIYKVSGFLTLNQKIIIPKDKRCFSYDILTREEQDCFDFDEQIMEKYVEGNLNWEVPETYLKITADDLYTANLITFYIPAQDILSVPESFKVSGGPTVPGRILEDLGVPGLIANVSSVLPEIRESLQPIYS